MSRLEDYFKENKDQMDVYQPSEDLWDKVRDRVHQRKPKKKFPFLRVAALIVFLFMAAVIFRLATIQQQEQPSGWSSELTDINAYYSTLVQQKIEQLEVADGVDPQAKEDIYDLLDDFDSDLEVLKKDFEEELDNEVVMQALVEHYRKKLEILESTLKRLQSVKSEKKNDEKLI